MGNFDGKAVIVTGGGSGIGAATAVEFANEGASVCVADVNQESGASVIDGIRESGGEGLFVRADVSQSADCRRVVEETAAAYGGVDILFSNAGILPLDSLQNVEDTPEEMWDRIIGVNLKSRFLMAKYAIPEMRKRGGGVIINNASVQGLQSMPLVPAYAASKGGDLSLTREMALDYAAENIRVLAICPGTIDTEIVRVLAREAGGDIEDRLVEFGEPHPLRRIGTGQDIANAVLFLASDKASFMTGSYVCVDGGLMAQGAWASGAGGQN